MSGKTFFADIDISKFIEIENTIIENSKKSCSDEIKAFDAIRLLGKEISDSIINSKDIQKARAGIFYLSLFHVIHSYIRLSFVETLRGHYIETLAVLRTSLEMTSHLFNMAKSPSANINIWKNQEKAGYKKQYKKIYEDNLFNGAPEALKKLKNIYYKVCSTYSSHASKHSLEYKIEVKKGKGITDIHFHDFHADNKKSILHLILILHCAQQILVLLKEIFRDILVGVDYIAVEARCNISIEQIEVLKKRYSGWRKYCDDLAKGKHPFLIIPKI